MRCICGYEYKDIEKRLEGWEPLEQRLSTGDIPFVSIETPAMVYGKGSGYISLGNMGGQFDACLHICPKCGTVRAERWGVE